MWQFVSSTADGTMSVVAASENSAGVAPGLWYKQPIANPCGCMDGRSYWVNEATLDGLKFMDDGYKTMSSPAECAIDYDGPTDRCSLTTPCVAAADAYTPQCDLDAATDGSADCAAGCDFTAAVPAIFATCDGVDDGTGIAAACTGTDDGTGSACALLANGRGCAVLGGDCDYFAATAGAACMLSSDSSACAVQGGDCAYTAATCDVFVRPATCTGTSTDPTLTCDLDAATDDSVDCPDGCTSTAATCTGTSPTTPGVDAVCTGTATEIAAATPSSGCGGCGICTTEEMSVFAAMVSGTQPDSQVMATYAAMEDGPCMACGDTMFSDDSSNVRFTADEYECDSTEPIPVADTPGALSCPPLCTSCLKVRHRCLLTRDRMRPAVPEQLRCCMHLRRSRYRSLR